MTGMGLEKVAIPDSLDGLDNRELMRDYVVRAGRLQLRKPESSAAVRVALVTPHGVPCGISTYSEWLWQALRPLVGEAHIFAERETGAPEGDHITRCWDRGEPLSELVRQIEDYGPSVVLVQHEYGYFPQARHWLSFMGALSNFRVVTTLHSVYEAHHDKTIVEAACPEIVVHTEAARQALMNAHGVSGKIHVIPHGCNPPDGERLWNLYGSPHTILQFGFGFPYKGWENALETVAALKGAYPSVFYTGLVSERWPGSTKPYVAELNALARRLGISENIALIRGFQTDRALDAYLRTNQVALFPYRDNGEHSVLGCSGAARVAMTKQLPVVAAGVPLFDDLEGVVPRPTTVDGWAQEISQAFENPGAQVQRQNDFLRANSWDNVARRYVDVLT